MATDSGITRMSEKEQKELLAKLLADKQKAKDRAKKYRDENPEKAKAWSERARVRSLLMVEKAKKAGIVVTEKEVDEYLKGK